MKRALILAAIAAHLLVSPAGAEEQPQYERDMDTRNHVWRRGADIFAVLYNRNSRLWKAARTLEACGWPVPSELALSAGDLLHEVIEHVSEAGDLDLVVQIALVVEGLRTGYLLGVGEAEGTISEQFGRQRSEAPLPEVCRHAQTVADEAVAARR